MQREIMTHKIRCDFFGCSNLAKYSFKKKNFLNKDLHFCEECMKELYEQIGGVLVPKGIEAPFKLKKEKK